MIRYFAVMKTTLLYLGLGEAYLKLLLSIMAGPILFCVGRTFSVGVRPWSGICQGDPLSLLLFDVIKVVIIYDIKSLNSQLCCMLMIFFAVSRGGG